MHGCTPAVPLPLRAMTGSRLCTRFAPSPTGELHVGNVRTALFNWLLARRHGGRFILRIEDTDAARGSETHIDALLAELRWLGLNWDEGPDVDGPAAPYRQSHRAALYARYFTALETQDHAYPCFCDEEVLAAARRARLAAGRPPRYPGTCARLSRAEANRRLAAGERAALRFRVPAGEMVVFEDLIKGEQRFASDDIGDFIIRRMDGTPAFFFSNAVDDALMGVTHALRGEDHLANTPRQILLLRALGLAAPRYGHLPLVLGSDDDKLSKRSGSGSLRALREAGYLPQALVNYLARLGHRYPDDGWRDLDALARDFELARVGRAPAHFDGTQLDHWQREAVARLDDAAFAAWAKDAVGNRFDAARSAAFHAAVRPNVLFPRDVARWAEIVDVAPVRDDAQARAAIRAAGEAFFRAAAEGVTAHGADWERLVAYLRETTGVRGGALFRPLRAALTGLLAGPELPALLALIGAPAARERFLAAARECTRGDEK